MVARGWGGPGSAADPGGMLPRGLLWFPRSDCFLSRPPSRKGQEAIEGRKLVGLSHGEPALALGGLCHRPGPQPLPGVPLGRRWPVLPVREVQTWVGGSRVAARPFPSWGIPHRSPRAVWKRSGM